MNPTGNYYVRGPNSQSQAHYWVHVVPASNPKHVIASWHYDHAPDQVATMPATTAQGYVAIGLWVPAPYLQLQEGL